MCRKPQGGLSDVTITYVRDLKKRTRLGSSPPLRNAIVIAREKTDVDTASRNGRPADLRGAHIEQGHKHTRYDECGMCANHEYSDIPH